MKDLGMMAEERYGIKADSGDVQKLAEYIQKTYGDGTAETLEKVFSSGEAAGFLTVGETYFFREPVHFDFLKDLLPSFEITGISICSAATASGCEAYSIAMFIEAYNKGIENPIAYKIDAFDINPNAIENACRGQYGARSMREDGSVLHYMTIPYLKKNPTENVYQIEDSLKKNIRFFVHNLMNGLNPDTYDIIFFRNAFIYFSHTGRERILSNLLAALKGGGILILGVSETAGAHHSGFEEKNRGDVFYFQKPVGKKGILL